MDFEQKEFKEFGKIKKEIIGMVPFTLDRVGKRIASTKYAERVDAYLCMCVCERERKKERVT